VGNHEAEEEDAEEIGMRTEDPRRTSETHRESSTPNSLEEAEGAFVVVVVVASALVVVGFVAGAVVEGTAMLPQLSDLSSRASADEKRKSNLHSVVDQ